MRRVEGATYPLGMPFTPSHVAAVLPLRRVGGGALPFAALAAGSMAPDLPYYLPVLGVLTPWTHTAAGVVTVDVVLGLAMWALWRSAAGALRDLSPAAVRERWVPAGWTVAAWWVVPLALAIGAATHVGWDEFTHPGRWGTTALPALAASYPSPVGPLAGYRYAQYASGAVGLAAVALAAWRRPRTRGEGDAGHPALARSLPWLVGAAGLAGGVARVLASGGFGLPWDAIAFAGLTGGIGVAALTLLAVCWGVALAPRMVGWARAGGGATGQPGERAR